MSKKLLGYVAGPYSQGDVAVNVARAMAVGSSLVDMGCAVIVPHLTHFLHMAHPKPYRTWIEVDLAIVPRCDFLFRLSGPSRGADEEEEVALENNVPIFTDLITLNAWLKSRKEL